MVQTKFTEHSSGLHVSPPEFVCDVCINDRITDPLPNTAFFMALIGSAGSGKTSLMVNFMTKDEMYHKAFDHVHMVCPKNSLKSLKDDIWDGHPSEKMHHTLDFGTLNYIQQQCLERAVEKPKPKNTLLIIDDMTIFLKKKEIESKLRDLIYNRRHLHLSIMVLVQSYNAMPLDLRKTLSHFFLFRPRNKKEAEAIWEELMFVPKKTGAALLRYTFRDKYDFLMGNCNTGELYRNFNLMDIAEEGDDIMSEVVDTGKKTISSDESDST